MTRIVYQRINAPSGTLGPPVVLIDATKRTGLSQGVLGYRYDWKTPTQRGAVPPHRHHRRRHHAPRALRRDLGVLSFGIGRIGLVPNDRTVSGVTT